MRAVDVMRVTLARRSVRAVEREQDDQPESVGTVLVALAANAGIAVAKGVAAAVSGSAAMAAETAHSVADTANEVILLVALRRSDRPPDRDHPFGYGPERFFWSFVAAVSIFVSGAVFAAIEGIDALLGPAEEAAGLVISSVVLALAFVLEGISWVRATRQVRHDAREHDQSVRELLRSTDDPTVKTVFYEDSAALVGVVLAFAGIWLHHLTGSSVPDAIASLLIAALLAVVAFLLARTNKNLLVGSQADPRLIRAVGALAGVPAAGGRPGRPDDPADRHGPRAGLRTARLRRRPGRQPRSRRWRWTWTASCAWSSRTSPRSSWSPSPGTTRSCGPRCGPGTASGAPLRWRRRASEPR